MPGERAFKRGILSILSIHAGDEQKQLKIKTIKQMKGKGKKSKDADDEEEDEDECPLQFIEFEAMDNASAPVYSSGIHRDHSTSIISFFF